MTDLLRFPAPSGAAEGRAPDFGLGRSGFEAWRAFIVAHALVTRRLDEELRAAHGITLAVVVTFADISRIVQGDSLFR